MRSERRRSSTAGRSGRPATGRSQGPGRVEKSGGRREPQNGEKNATSSEGGDHRRDGTTAEEEEEEERRPAPAPVRIKVIGVGDAETGKTCIIKRHCEGRFVSRYMPTVGIDFGVKSERVVRAGGGKDPPDVRVNFFDFSGDAEYLDVRNEFYKDAGGAFLVFDCTDRATFGRLGKWLDEMKEYGADPSCVPVALCANKIDKLPRQVKESDGLAFASSNSLSYFEISAQSGEGISAMFQTLFQTIVQKPPVSGWK